MTLTQLKTFLWVAKLGGFRRAAEKLHTSQPAISARIGGLEEQLGVPLFERASGGVTLTAKGRELLVDAEKIVALAESTRRRIGAPEAHSGVLRLGVSETIVHAWLSRFLARFSSVFPNVDLDLAVDVSVNLRDGLLNRSLDLAFLMGPVSEYSVTNIDLSEFRLAWFAAGPVAELARRGDIEAVFARYPVITFARNTRPFSEIKTALFERYGPGTRLFPSSSLAACFQMVRDGVGIGALPAELAAVHVRGGSMVEVDLDWQPGALRFTASYVSDPVDSLTQSAAELAAEIASEAS